MAIRKGSLQANQSVEDAFIQILKADMAQINEWSPIAFAGKDIEGVHQMRVGLRRMRSALILFRLAIPRNATRKLAREMRWSAQQLDYARDLDVYITDNLSLKDNKKGKGEKQIQKVAYKHRKEAYRQVRNFIQGERFGALKEKLSHWLDAKEWRRGLSKKDKKNLTRKITPFASEVMQEHRAKILIIGKNIRQMDAKALHNLRIECKKLRYASDFFSPLYGKKMLPFSRCLKRLQDVLGLLHDCAVMEGLQNDLLKKNRSKKFRKVAEKLMDQRKKSMLDLEEILLTAWSRFVVIKAPWQT